MNKGMVYVFTGEGKGKTSAAIGTAVRAAGSGMKVAWVGWYKQTSWKLSEMGILKQLGIDVLLAGEGFYLKGKKIADLAGGARAVDKANREGHQKAAQKALDQAREWLGAKELVVMDEVNNAIKDGLIGVEEVVKIIDHRGKSHLVLTGREAHPTVVELADLVTEMKKVKHPYDKGKLAVRGLDF